MTRSNGTYQTSIATNYHIRHTYGCWMLSAGANPALIANQMGHENAQMVYTVYSARINALDVDQIAFLNQRIGGYSSVNQLPPEVDEHQLTN